MCKFLTNCRFIQLSAVLAFTFFSSKESKAQMTGSYTIDSSVAASSTNFKNWYSFWRSLQGQTRTDGGSTLAGGISASVSVTVKSNLTDTSSVKFPVISGVTSGKTITINGNGKFLAYAKSGEVISFQGGDYITIKNLIIRNTGTASTNATCIRFYNNSDNNTILGCTLEFSGISSGNNDGSSYVAFCTSQTILSTLSSTLTGSNNTIKANLCRTTNSNSPGPAYGFAINGSNTGYTGTAHNNTFDSNTIQNFYYTAVLSNYTNGNQFTRNNISRANASSTNCSSVLYGFNLQSSYASSREFSVSSNTIHDLPYSGAAASNGVTEFYGITGTDNIGNKNYNFRIQSNTFSTIYATDNPVAAILRNSQYMQILQNTIDHFEANTTAGVTYIWDIVTGDEMTLSGNVVKNCILYSKQTNVMYVDDFTANQTGNVMITDNIIRDNNFEYEAYLIATMYNNFNISRNKLQNNTITAGNGGYIYCMLLQEFESMTINNNLITGNVGSDGIVGIYAVSFNGTASTFNCHQNTVYLDGTSITSGSYDNNGIYTYPYYQTDIRFSGNIVYLKEASSGVVIGTDCASTSAVTLFENNTYYIKNISSEVWFVPGGNSASDFSGWQGLGFAGSGENFTDPLFTNISGGDFHPKKWILQNNVTTQSTNKTDIDQAVRNSVKSDRGVYEQVADIKAVSSTFSIGTNVCSGFTKKVSFKIQNLFSDTVFDFNVSYSVNGGTKVTQKITKKLLPNDTLTVVFTTPLTLVKWGKARIAVFVDVPDDKTSNDSIIFNTTVQASPGGRNMTASGKPTKAIYKGSNPFAVAFVGEPVYININAPRGKTNSAYGTTWTSSAYATLQSGAAVGTLTNSNPAASTDQEVKYVTTNLALEDSIVKVCVKTTDLQNGCDTTICGNILIKSIIVPKFSYPAKICGNDTAKFINKSNVKSGAMRFHWDFGTGNPKDTSSDVDPVFFFPGNGTYKVKMTAYTMPYGFATSDSAVVNVSPKPVAKFTRTNACEGFAIKFTNSSTPTSSTNDWDFGDASSHSTVYSPSHVYAVAGQYTVKLKVNLNGCIDSASAKVFQYPKPKANFTKGSGTCDNEVIKYTNSSTVDAGILSSYWDFGNGNKSNTTDGSFKYATGGDKNTKLVVKSDFGCMDSITKTYNIKLAPKVAFSGNKYCSLSSTKFKDSTPAISLVTFNYSWRFGDNTFSSAQNPSHSWANLGPKMVTLKVLGDNGCSDSLIKTIIVKSEPKAAFTHTGNICSGGNVAFNNGTTWSSGNISYVWHFGDGNSSTQSDPQNTYTVTKTTTYFVSLIASIQDGCTDSINKSITVNAPPQTCDFRGDPDYASSYWGMKFTPADGNGNPGAQSGVDYEWTINGVGKYNTPTVTVALPADNSYSVTMCAYTTSTPRCTCCLTKQIVMNREPTNYYELPNIRVFPNPNKGQFNIVLSETVGAEITLKIVDMRGTLQFENKFNNTGLLSISKENLSDGVYSVQVISGDKIFSKNIVIIH